MHTPRQNRVALNPRPAAVLDLAPRAGAFTAALLLSLGAGSLSGCASTARSPAPESEAAAIGGRPALTKLRALAATEKPWPIEAPIPPGIDARAIAPGVPSTPEAARRAGLDAKAALAEIAAETPLQYATARATPPVALPAPDPERAAQALRLYVNARDLRQSGQAAAAATDLQAAAELDPASPEIHLELAEAQLAAGRRLAATSALQRAAALGTDSPRAYWLLANDEMTTQSPAAGADAAAWLLVKARSLQSAAQDPALPYLLDAALADVLSRLGYAAASAELLELALDLPDQLPSQTNYRAEYGDLIRRQADGSRDLGDARARLGDFEAASRLYDRAAELPSLDPGAILSRRVYARVRAGRPASAALVMVESIEDSEGLVEDRQIALLSTLLSKTSAALPLAAAIAEMERVQNDQLTPRSRSGLTRAVAASSPAAAQAPLKALLVREPDDHDAMRDLLAAQEHPARVSTLVELVSVSSDPHALAQNAAEALVVSGQNVASSLANLAKRSDDASALLQTQILLSLHLPVAALERCATRTWSPPFAIAGHESTARAAAIAGDWLIYDRAVAALEALGEPAALSRTRALLAGQRFKAAYAASTEVKGGSNQTVTTLLTLARAAQLGGPPQEAAAFLQSAIEADRFDERGYEALLSVHAPSGPLPDNEKLTAALRGLRQNIPSSRLIRWLSAQDLVQRGSLVQAERTLLSLAEEDPGAPKLVEVLLAIWDRAPKIAQADAETWLRAKLAERPESVPLRAAMARLLAKSGRTDEALSQCDLIFAGLTPPDLLRARERILRETGNVPQAEAAAQDRRAASGQGIDASIDAAESLAMAGKLQDAAAALLRGVPAGADLSPDQTIRINGMIAAACQSTAPDLSADQLAALFDFADSRRLLLAPEVHEARLRRIAAMPGISIDQLAAAAHMATRQYPALGERPFRRVAATLIDAGAGDRADAFLIAQIKSIPGATKELVFDTFRLTVTNGDAACVNAFIDTFDNPEWLDTILIQVQVSDTIPETLIEKRAEVAYALGVVLNDAGRDQLAALAYRRTLEFQPNHPWASNNLGYQIAEQNGDLAEAEALLRRAVAALPDDGSVLDSLGWILFKQGRLADIPASPDTPALPGALTLLARAASSLKGSENPTILDHYGDALWTSGDPQKATANWTLARQAIRSQLQILRLANTNRQMPQVATRLETLQASIAAKLDAVAAGRPPLSPATPAPAQAPAKP